MKNVHVYFVFLFFLASCINNNINIRDDPSEQNLRKHAAGIAETYVKGDLNNAKKAVSKNGLIVLTDKEVKCLIDPSKIVIGEIDEDNYTDAIAPVYFFRNQTLEHTDHLVLINTDGKFVITITLKNELKVVSIKDRMIYAEIPKLAPDAPNFGCAVCKEVVKYKFAGDSLARVK